MPGRRRAVALTALAISTAFGCGDALEPEAERELRAIAAAAVRADVKLGTTGSATRALAGDPLGSRFRGVIEERAVTGPRPVYGRGEVEIEEISLDGDDDTARADVTALVKHREHGSDDVGMSVESYVIDFRRSDRWTVVSLRNPSEFDPDG